MSPVAYQFNLFVSTSLSCLLFSYICMHIYMHRGLSLPWSWTWAYKVIKKNLPGRVFETYGKNAFLQHWVWTCSQQLLTELLHISLCARQSTVIYEICTIDPFFVGTIQGESIQTKYKSANTRYLPFTEKILGSRIINLSSSPDFSRYYMCDSLKNTLHFLLASASPSVLLYLTGLLQASTNILVVVLTATTVVKKGSINHESHKNASYAH